MSIEAYLVVAAALVGVGLYGALSQQSIVMVMMGIELMLNGVLLTVVTFWSRVAPGEIRGQVLAIVVFLVMAVEAAIGFAIAIAIYRTRKVDVVDAATKLKG